MEVLEFLEVNRYPSKETVFQWNKKQFEYFYSLCESYGLDPNIDDDDDVISINDGMAGFMKGEGVNVQVSGNGIND